MRLAGFAFPPHRFGSPDSTTDDQGAPVGRPDAVFIDKEGWLLVLSGRTGELSHGYADADKLLAHREFARNFAWIPPGVESIEAMVASSELPDLLQVLEEPANPSMQNALLPSASPEARYITQWITEHTGQADLPIPSLTNHASLNDLQSIANEMTANLHQLDKCDADLFGGRCMTASGLQPMLQNGHDCVATFMVAHGLRAPLA